MRFATDTGGTFTDLVVEKDGMLHLFKSPTVPSNPVAGVLGAFSVAADAFGVDRKTLLQMGNQFIHGTTHAINAIVTGRTARTALLVTEGHPDILLLREGGRERPFDHTVRYQRAYIPPALTFEVPGRLVASGAENKPLDVAAITAIADRLAELEVEAVAVSLLWSIVNNAHELEVERILRERLPDVPITLSHRLNPSLREYRRTISTAIDASLKPLMDRYVGGLENAMREAGFEGRVLVLTSQGSMVSADEIRRSPILALNSGPSMAPIAGSYVANADADEADTIVFDTGGTTFDVSLVRGGYVPFTHESWLGRPYQSDLTGFPSVDVKSVGAGGGSIAWVDDGGVLHVGPQSAGSTPGPVCYGAGGTEPTVTDASLALGYIDPDYFLGGSIRLDRDAAIAAIRQKVADPLGLTVEEAGLAMLEVWTENMVQAIADITVNQGIDPGTASIIGGGGAAGLNAVAIAQRMGCPTLLIPEVGAGLSAAGAVVSDVGRGFRRLFVTSTADYDAAGVRAKLAELQDEAEAFVAQMGVGAVQTEVSYFAEARYAHQVWEIDVALNLEDMDDAGEALREAFHEAHERIFAFRDTASTVEVIAWRAQVACKVAETTELRIAPDGAEGTALRHRQAYFSRLGLVEVPVHTFERLETDQQFSGPAIVESRFTCVVIQPGVTFQRSAVGTLVIRPELTPETAKELN
ncbi:hydantoinase/oxoprolinase family protein [Aureimonas fodinaquatilis]|uniref:Hydantoinase/oxoprolinase family protein n=1 Tax=Aureimonas fodinaquatilis TaxID=2565783 RepID=A0A5B0E031_9HYPH|nr:hydantoinase/oxoprolinase family protein [Aureimonas fodinaquatilis]KAA0972163.1 hydantoinase/oxoprolinase family protein [Aureimonas fodinaquatilis]